MSEKDLGLKVEARRLLWSMGFSTRIDVPLRTPVPYVQNSRSGRFESYTDLDVLGVSVAPGFAITKTIVDCKTTARGAVERMFWLRGLADFFDSHDAWMVRSQSASAASRQLAGRLGISVLDPSDLGRLREFHVTTIPLESEPMRHLFDAEQVATYLHSFTTLDKRLRTLVEYRQFDYWVLEPYRNLQQLVVQLARVAKHLDPGHPAHRALFLECVWLYALSLGQAAQHARAVHVADIDTALQQYLFGGQAGLEEKRHLAAMLSDLGPKQLAVADHVLPAWYKQLLELLVRHLRRPDALVGELQYAEWLADAQIAKLPHTVPEAFGIAFEPVRGKLLADVAGFLVAASGLDPEFRTHVHQALGLTEATPAGASAGRPRVSPSEAGEHLVQQPELDL